MTLSDGWAFALSKYASFTGRARRTEYFSFFLLQFGWYMAILFTTPWSLSEAVVGWLFILSGMFFLLPNLAIAVRRLHDIGLSGWVVLLSLVPLGQVALFFMAMVPPQDGADRYGPDPRDEDDTDPPSRGGGGSRVPRV